MRITRDAKQLARKLFNLCKSDGIFEDARARAIVNEVIRTKPRNYMAVLAWLERLITLEKDMNTAVVESAIPVNQSDYITKIEATHGKGLEFVFKVVPELIGGTRIRIGSNVYDGSIQGRLAALEKSLISG